MDHTDSGAPRFGGGLLLFCWHPEVVGATEPRNKSQKTRSKGSQTKGLLDAAVVCPLGLETVCANELRALGLKPKKPGPGLVPVSMTTRQLYAANLWLRTASRILVRLRRFKATDWPHLQDRMAEVDLSDLLAEGVAPAFRVSSTRSQLFHTDAIAQRLHQVVGPPSIDPEQTVQPFVVRIDDDVVTLSIDTTGEPLHRRPWRTAAGPSPLRPTLAAGLLALAEWDATTPLADPFCGTGTIAIEAALIAAHRPPSERREFSFHHWPAYEGGTWASVTGEAKKKAQDAPDQLPPIIGSDRSAGAIEAATVNAANAGITVELTKKVVAHLSGASGPGLVATNPPYGVRSGNKSQAATSQKHSTGQRIRDMAPLYKRAGAVIRERRPDHSIAILSPHPSLTKALHQGLKPLVDLSNGGLKVTVAVYHPTPDPDQVREEGPTSGTV